MKIRFSQKADEDLIYFQKSGNKSILRKVSILIENIKKTPFSGMGKPEQLKYNHQGRWSRRITQEHRIIYKLFEEKENDFIYIYRLKDHYEKKKS